MPRTARIAIMMIRITVNITAAAVKERSKADRLIRGEGSESTTEVAAEVAGQNQLVFSFHLGAMKLCAQVLRGFRLTCSGRKALRQSKFTVVSRVVFRTPRNKRKHCKPFLGFC